jgi:hypothetical protein
MQREIQWYAQPRVLLLLLLPLQLPPPLLLLLLLLMLLLLLPLQLPPLLLLLLLLLHPRSTTLAPQGVRFQPSPFKVGRRIIAAALLRMMKRQGLWVGAIKMLRTWPCAAYWCGCTTNAHCMWFAPRRAHRSSWSGLWRQGG